MEWKPSSVASHRLLPLLTLLAIFLVFLVTFLCSVFSVFSGQHFFCFLKEWPLWPQLYNDLVSSWNCQITKCTLWSNCTTCSELFLAWFHCEIRAGLQVATARSTAVSPNLLLLWRRQIRTTFYNLELGLNTWIFCRYFVDPRIYVCLYMTYVCVQNIKPCEFSTLLEDTRTQGAHTLNTKTHFCVA